MNVKKYTSKSSVLFVLCNRLFIQVHFSYNGRNHFVAFYFNYFSYRKVCSGFPFTPFFHVRIKFPFNKRRIYSANIKKNSLTTIITFSVKFKHLSDTVWIVGSVDVLYSGRRSKREPDLEGPSVLGRSDCRVSSGRDKEVHWTTRDWVGIVKGGGDKIRDVGSSERLTWVAKERIMTEEMLRKHTICVRDIGSI